MHFHVVAEKQFSLYFDGALKNIIPNYSPSDGTQIYHIMLTILCGAKRIEIYEMNVSCHW
jgi:hypothetical protein